MDPEDLERPGRWDVGGLRSYMIVFGIVSSAFDLLTFAVLLTVFDADAPLFRTGWFVGSTLTELAVLFVLRTRRRGWRSRPSRALVATSLSVAAGTLALPFVPGVAAPLGLTAPPPELVAALIGLTTAYVLVAELTKILVYRRRPPPPGAEEGAAAAQRTVPTLLP